MSYIMLFIYHMLYINLIYLILFCHLANQIRFGSAHVLLERSSLWTWALDTCGSQVNLLLLGFLGFLGLYEGGAVCFWNLSHPLHWVGSWIWHDLTTYHNLSLFFWAKYSNKHNIQTTAPADVMSLTFPDWISGQFKVGKCTTSPYLTPFWDFLSRYHTRSPSWAVWQKVMCVFPLPDKEET